MIICCSELKMGKFMAQYSSKYKQIDFIRMKMLSLPMRIDLNLTNVFIVWHLDICTLDTISVQAKSTLFTTQPKLAMDYGIAFEY